MRHPWICDPIVRKQLAEVETALVAACFPDPSGLHQQLTSPSSKRLRPALLLLAARLGPADSSDIVLRAATGIELLHEATLYHDDIVDEAAMRRGEITVQRAFGPATAAFAGSELLYATARFFADVPAALRRPIGRAGDALCRGQLHEVEATGDLTVTVRERLRIMRDKTARLFALAAHLGAKLGGSEPRITVGLARFALRFGMCFQLADDLLDLVASAEDLGRPPGSDLLDGIYTLPTVFGTTSGGHAAGALRASLSRLLFSRDSAELSTCLAFLKETGGIQRALGTLESWITAARIDLRALPLASTPALRSLHRLLGWLPTRVLAAIENNSAPYRACELGQRVAENA